MSYLYANEVIVGCIMIMLNVFTHCLILNLNDLRSEYNEFLNQNITYLSGIHLKRNEFVT